MVEIGDLAHVVMRDGRCGMFADDLGLQPVERGHLVTGKAAVGHHMGGVRFGHGQVGQVDLVETGIIHRPEHIAPRTVQRLRRLIALRQPVAEGAGGGGRIGQHGIMASIFVVGLPRGHERVAAIAFGHCRHDARAFGAIGAVAKAIVAAGSKPARLAVAIQCQHVGVFGQHPARRGGGGRAQDHLQPRAAQHLDGAVQPFPLEVARFRLHPAPCEFADPHPCQAKVCHAGGILGPLGFGPVFGVIADAKRALHRIT
jgi:hypothetical protein